MLFVQNTVRIKGVHSGKKKCISHTYPNPVYICCISNMCIITLDLYFIIVILF